MKSLLPLLASVYILFYSAEVFAQATSSAVELKQVGEQGVLLDKGWRFRAGDNPQWREPGFDDRNWQPIDPTKDIKDIPELWENDIVWFRLRFTADSALAQRGLAVSVEQTGASEIYLNGQLIERFGTIGPLSGQVKAATPVRGTFISLTVRDHRAEQVLAVRYAAQKNLPYIIAAGRPNTTLTLKAMEMRGISRYFPGNIHLFFDFLRGGLYLILSILHLALFWFNPSKKANLYFFIFTCLLAAASFLVSLMFTHAHYAATKLLVLFSVLVSGLLGNLFFLLAIYEMFGQVRGVIYRLIVGVSLLSTLLYFIHYHRGGIVSETVLPLLVFMESTRITVLAAKQKKRGAKIVIAGTAGFLVFHVLIQLMSAGFLPAGADYIFIHIAYNVASLSLPVSISIYLALEASYASRALTEKLDEVQQLSEKTIAQEQEKQQILASQKETLELQVVKRTVELKQSLEELKATQAQLVQREKMASLGELTSGIAHEIQNPLNFVNNFSEVSQELVEELKQEAAAENLAEVLVLAEGLKQNLQKIQSHGQRADAIVKNMLQHSRPASGEKQLTNLNALAGECLQLAYAGFRAKDKDFTCALYTDFDLNAPEVLVVPQELGRVLLNLYNNAFYALQQKQSRSTGQYQPEVRVSTGRVGELVEIRVRDNGIGLSEGVKGKIFQPFFTTRPAGQGTGLGLYLSYDIIKAHGGELTVRTKEGEHAEFIIRLPA